MEYIKNTLFIMMTAMVAFWGVVIVGATMTENSFILDTAKKFTYTGSVSGSNAISESIEFAKPVRVHQILIAGNGVFSTAEDFVVRADLDSDSSDYEVRLLSYDLGTNAVQYYRSTDDLGWFIPSGGNCVIEYTNTDDNDIYFHIEGYEYHQSN